MPLDGLRAWIGEVERKLGMRTRVFLVLATIAIGGAGAAIYLAVDTRNDAVSEGDVQELQAELEGQGGTGSADTTQLEAEVRALQAQVARLSGDSASGSGEAGKGGSSGTGGAGAADSGASGSGGETGATGGAPPQGKLEDLLEQAQE